ncbi:MAG TPA: recombinase family protein [Abditibacteriaceae bacterium]|jgi:site-specific DNA recombinase
MNEGLRAVLYGRVSTEEQAKNNTSLPFQYAGNVRKAKDIGAVEVETIEDEDSGEWYLTRKGLQRALGLLESGKANCIIVKDKTRFFRTNELETAQLKKRIKDAGGRVIYWDVEFEDSPMGQFADDMTDSYGRMEKRFIRSRTMQGRKSRAEEGKQPCRTHAPFGFVIPKKSQVVRGEYSYEQLGKYLLHPVHAPIVKEIFDRMAGGDSMHSITRWLQSSGVPTINGGQFWRVSNLKVIFSNPAYYGSAAFGRARTIRDESRQLQGYKGRTYEVPVPEDEWIRIECPAIVSRKQWDRCQERIAEMKEKMSTREVRRQLLTGMLRCPKCLRVMTGRAHRKGMVSHYKCKEAAPSSTSAGIGCWNKHINIKNIDPQVMQLIKRLAFHSPVIELAYDAYQQNLTSGHTESEYRRLKGELIDLKKEVADTVRAQIRGVAADVDTDVYEEILRGLSLKKASIVARLEAIEHAREEAASVDETKGYIETAMREALKVLEAPEDVVPTHRKNAILHKIIHHIYPSMDGTHFTITFAAFDEITRLVVVVSADELPRFEVVVA